VAEELTRRRLLGYGIGSIGTGIVGALPGLLLLIFLTDTLGVPAGWAGLILLVPKACDVVLNPIVDIDNRTATARSTFCVIQNTETVPLQPIVVGRYFDTFSCDDSGWYFTERKVEIQMIGDVSAHLMVDPTGF